MRLFFTSDTHFGDARRIRIDKRPFASIAEHDAGLIARWNETVGPNDEVWHLGDVAPNHDSAAVKQLLTALNGRKHLIIGNNDPPVTIECRLWASTQHYAELTIGEHRLVLCHYPFRTWNKMGKGVIDLHGHSHGKLKELPHQYDVGVDVFDYRPVTLAKILASKR
ncbi:MAG: metallophosphoesterase family protein [Beijerinckiaceae bacterium]